VDGCQACFLTLREEHRLKVFGNKVLRIIFGARREELTGGWRQLHNEELHNLYSSPVIVIKLRRMTWASHVACIGHMRSVSKILVGKPGGKRSLVRLKCSGQDNIKMHFNGM
jgi:hypothetical protein